MEQTSSSAYPNVLVVDYVKKARVASPAMLAKAEQYLNVGYQKLLTFERPGGGFDWWGREEPMIWTSAYGLQQFSDMSKVYPIDRGIIDRTQQLILLVFIIVFDPRVVTSSNILIPKGKCSRQQRPKL